VENTKTTGNENQATVAAFFGGQIEKKTHVIWKSKNSRSSLFMSVFRRCPGQYDMYVLYNAMSSFTWSIGR
jgi:hypothetical protein